MSAEQNPKLLKNRHFLEQGPLHSTVLRYIHMVNTRYIPDLIYFFSKWPRLNRVNYGPKPKSLRWKMSTCGDGNFPLCRFFDEIFFSQRIYFQALQKKLFFLLLRFHSPTLSVIFWLALSNANCSFLPTQKVLLFRPHITRKKPKTFSMNTYILYQEDAVAAAAECLSVVLWCLLASFL